MENVKHLIYEDIQGKKIMKSMMAYKLFGLITRIAIKTSFKKLKF